LPNIGLFNVSREYKPKALQKRPLRPIFVVVHECNLRLGKQESQLLLGCADRRLSLIYGYGYGWDISYPRQAWKRVNGDDEVPDEDLQVAVLWDDVGCPNRGRHKGRRRTAVGELGHLLPYWWSMMATRLSCTVMKICSSWSFWSHVKSTVTWPLDPPTPNTLP